MKEIGHTAEPTDVVFAAFSADARRILTVSGSGAVQAHYRSIDDLLVSARCVRDRGHSKTSCEAGQPTWPRDGGTVTTASSRQRERNR
jgi:hypothetical protein